MCVRQSGDGAAKPAKRRSVTRQRLVAAGPVEPGDGVVLRVGVVVALLSTAEFIACGQHDGAARGKQRCKQRALVVEARLGDRRTVRPTLGAIVPGQIVVVAVAVLLAIGRILLALIGDDVGQRYAVMGGDEIDRAAGWLAGLA